MTRVLALVAAAALLAAGPAFADDTIATATSADAHPPGAGPSAPGPLVATADPRRGGGDVLMTACGPEPVNDKGVAAMTPHGEVSVGVGTRGYREVGGSVCQPLPGGAFVAVSAGSSRIGR
jgi:hypothetical protein